MAALAFGQIDRLSTLAASVAPLANGFLHLPPGRWLLERALGVHPSRQLPQFQKRTFTQTVKRSERSLEGIGQTHPTVALFPDTFTEFNEPRQGLAAIRVLTSAGLDVELTPRLCCGRPALSSGLVSAAQSRARRLVEAGSTFVTVFYGGWDHHWDLKKGYDNYLPQVDMLVSGSFTELEQRGLSFSAQEFIGGTVRIPERLVRSNVAGISRLLRRQGRRVRRFGPRRHGPSPLGREPPPRTVHPPLA